MTNLSQKLIQGCLLKTDLNKPANTQLIYQEGHDLPFYDTPIWFTSEQIGRDFKSVSNHQPNKR